MQDTETDLRVLDYTAARTELRSEYVDTRGVWPLYVKGVSAIELRGKPHSISLDDARAVAKAIQ